MPKQIVLASSNKGKLRELQSRLAELAVEIIPQSQFAVVDADETGLSFVENAIIKARHAAKLSGLPAIADDSGLEVDYLRGQPGIYSARFAGPSADDAANNAKLLKQLAGVPAAQRSARFQCVLVYMRDANDPTPLICQGSWEGRILEQAAGENGFGYDPLFYVSEHRCSAAAMPPDIKNRSSHRGQALTSLLRAIGGINQGH